MSLLNRKTQSSGECRNVPRRAMSNVPKAHKCSRIWVSSGRHGSCSPSEHDTGCRQYCCLRLSTSHHSVKKKIEGRCQCPATERRHKLLPYLRRLRLFRVLKRDLTPVRHEKPRGTPTRRGRSATTQRSSATKRAKSPQDVVPESVETMEQKTQDLE